MTSQTLITKCEEEISSLKKLYTHMEIAVERLFCNATLCEQVKKPKPGLISLFFDGSVAETEEGSLLE